MRPKPDISLLLIKARPENLLFFRVAPGAGKSSLLAELVRRG
jgi:predicted ATPase